MHVHVCVCVGGGGGGGGRYPLSSSVHITGIVIGQKISVLLLIALIAYVFIFHSKHLSV